MKLYSTNNFWETRAVQQELAKHRVCWVSEGQNKFRDGSRDTLAVLDGEADQFLTDWSKARAVLEDVGKVFNSCRTSWRQKAEALLVLGPVSTETFAPITPTDHLCLDCRHRDFCW